MGGHVVNFSMEIGDDKWHECKDKLPRGVYNEIETRRELAIMHEVLKADGFSIDEKLTNTAAEWILEKNSNKKPVVVVERYKLRYKY